MTARDIIIATGSVPFVPPGIPIDGKTVFTSDHALKLEWVPNWVAIIGSGYIGLEFSDVYTALGSEVTFIEVHPWSLLIPLTPQEPMQVQPFGHRASGNWLIDVQGRRPLLAVCLSKCANAAAAKGAWQILVCIML